MGALEAVPLNWSVLAESTDIAALLLTAPLNFSVPELTLTVPDRLTAPENSVVPVPLRLRMPVLVNGTVLAVALAWALNVPWLTRAPTPLKSDVLAPLSTLMPPDDQVAVPLLTSCRPRV